MEKKSLDGLALELAEDKKIKLRQSLQGLNGNPCPPYLKEIIERLDLVKFILETHLPERHVFHAIINITDSQSLPSADPDNLPETRLAPVYLAAIFYLNTTKKISASLLSPEQKYEKLLICLRDYAEVFSLTK